MSACVYRLHFFEEREADVVDVSLDFLSFHLFLRESLTFDAKECKIIRIPIALEMSKGTRCHIGNCWDGSDFFVRDYIVDGTDTISALLSLKIVNATDSELCLKPKTRLACVTFGPNLLNWPTLHRIVTERTTLLGKNIVIHEIVQ